MPRCVALSDAVRDYAARQMHTLLRQRGPQQGLVDALYSKGQLKLEYDSAMTRNAAQAFEARAGNCLSLVIMTAAFAKHLGLPVRYQSVSHRRHLEPQRRPVPFERPRQPDAWPSGRSTRASGFDASPTC